MKSILIVLLAAAIAGCGGAGGNKDKETIKDNGEKKDTVFFPVTSFIEGQIHEVDSFQSVTMKYVTVGKKTEKTFISLEEFNQLAGEFIKPDFSRLNAYYKENSFADQSIKGVVFNYTTDKQDLEIQRIDVVVDASPVVSDKVRSIYMEKQSRSLDTFIYKKLYWRADRNFQIITTKEVAGKPGIVHVVKVEWN